MGGSPFYLYLKRNISPAESQLFQKEVKYFTKYLKDVGKLCTKMGMGDLMEIYPKCYHGDENLLVFEDLLVKYVVLDKMDKQDFISAEISIKNLARHHAISYAFIKEKGGKKAFFGKFPRLNYEAFMDESLKKSFGLKLETGIETVVNILEKSLLPGSMEMVERLNSFKGSVYDMLMETMDYQLAENDFLVLNHGEYNNGNIMFFKQNDKIIKQVMTSFQMTRYHSPGTDLGNLLFTSVEPKTRRERLSDLLKIYLDTFNLTAKELGHPVNLTMNQFEADFKRNFRLGFWAGILLMNKACLSVMEAVGDLSGEYIEDLDGVISNLARKWVDDNMKECVEIGKEILDSVKEVEKLICSRF